MSKKDLLGLAPYGEALKISVEKSFGAAEAILSRICLPAAEELGIMFRDKVRYWRLNNIIKIIEKTKGKIDLENDQLILTAHPKVVHEIIENGSWSDDETLQDMWAGLLSSSCNGENNGSDGNILYTNVLKQLTSNQAKIIKHLCENCKMIVDKNGLFMAEHIQMSLEELQIIFQTNDMYKIDMELDYLRSIELLGGNLFSHGAGFCFGQDNLYAELEPSSFAISLFVKSQGYSNSPKDFFKLEYVESDDKNK